MPFCREHRKELPEDEFSLNPKTNIAYSSCNYCLKRKRDYRKKVNIEERKEDENMDDKWCSGHGTRLSIEEFSKKKSGEYRKQCDKCHQRNDNIRKKRIKDLKDIDCDKTKWCQGHARRHPLEEFDIDPQTGEFYKTCRIMIENNMKFLNKKRELKKTSTMKWCTRHACLVPVDNFSIHKKTGETHGSCDECLDKRKEWEFKNMDKKTKHFKTYYDKNMKVAKEKGITFRKEDHDRYRKNNECVVRCRNRIREALHNNKKTSSTIDLLGCKVDYINGWFEYQLGDSFNIKDYEIDHFIPCSSFDFAEEGEQNKCFHWSNLQLLIPQDNREKSNKIPSDEECTARQRLIEQFLSKPQNEV